MRSRILHQRSSIGLAWLVLAAVACGGRPDRPASPPVATYQVKGQVRQIQVDRDGRTRLSIHHEAIPDFVGIDGRLEPMRAMTMPFAVAESVEVSNLAPGDKVRFELTVDWSAPEPGRITDLEVLPVDTTLDFERAVEESRP